MRKAFTIIAAAFLIFIFGYTATQTNIIYAESATEIINEGQLDEEVLSQLENLDFSALDKIIEDFSGAQASFFGHGDFFSKIIQLVAGEFDDTQGLFKNIINILFDSLLNLLPLISAVIAIALLGNIIQGLKPTTNGKSISNIIHFVSYGVIVILVLSIVVRMISLARGTLSSVQKQMNALFPILLTLLTAVGGTTSAAVYQPVMGLLTNGILNLFTYLLLPIFIFSVIFSVVSNLSNTVKLDKFASFFNSSFKWITGFVFTIFTAFLSLQGITAGSIDGISIRTAKYAIKSYVPVIGGYIGDGIGLILASSNLIKNAVGVAGLLMMAASIISPLIEMILFMLALKLIAGIIEPLGNKQVANFVSSLAKSMVLLIVILIGVAFAYFILLGLVMCSANLF
ncbi:MAG: stage III sporulation protein AE [Clostridia bacterium]|nr:stage III sporulation protein AE [Clostridia bacterium]